MKYERRCEIEKRDRCVSRMRSSTVRRACVWWRGRDARSHVKGEKMAGGEQEWWGGRREEGGLEVDGAKAREELVDLVGLDEDAVHSGGEGSIDLGLTGVTGEGLPQG
jgi:hypothetical protein